MTGQYAKDQPSGFKNHLSKIAIVGATGTAGRHIVAELQKNTKISITALTRESSTATMPAGISVAKVNYDDKASLVSAMRGHDCLVITMSVMAPPESSTKLIDAAAEAGVPWVLPNEYGNETNEDAARDTFIGVGNAKTRAYIESLGVSSWIAIACGFWYEFSLAGGQERFGFDLDKKEVLFFDDGERKITTSTWDQTGRGVAALLGLKIYREDENDRSPMLSDWRNKFTHFGSYQVNQKEMFASLLRVLGDKEGDWKQSSIPVEEYFKQGQEQLKGGDRVGFAKLLYSRMFFPDNAGNLESNYGLDNEKLGLPKEELDEGTKKGVQLWKDGYFKKNY